MKLPANCPHRRSAKNWRHISIDDDPDQPTCCRTTDHDIMHVYLPKRGPLCESAKHAVEEYRFTWCSSFHGDAVVQIGRGEKAISLDWACSSFTHGSGRFWRGLDQEAWQRLETAVLAAGFWALEARLELDLGLDGATWLIEGRRRDVYRAIRRWSPEGAIHDLGRTFLDIAGSPIADIGLY
jgi:hypothetical protein